MRRIAPTVDALKEMLQEVLGDALEAASEIGEREGKLVLHWRLIRESDTGWLEVDPEVERRMLMFRYFFPLQLSADQPQGTIEMFWLHWGINELNFRMEEGHFYYDTHHEPPSVVLVMPVVCYEDTVPEPVIRHYLGRIQELGQRFMPMLSELARSICRADEFEQHVVEAYELFKEVIEERARQLLRQLGE
jgi:hypothetical protein